MLLQPPPLSFFLLLLFLFFFSLSSCKKGGQSHLSENLNRQQRSPNSSKRNQEWGAATQIWVCTVWKFKRKQQSNKMPMVSIPNCTKRKTPKSRVSLMVPVTDNQNLRALTFLPRSLSLSFSLVLYWKNRPEALFGFWLGSSKIENVFSENVFSGPNTQNVKTKMQK